MTFLFTILRPFLTPILGVLVVLFMALGVGQCTGRLKAERALAKAEKQVAAAEADLRTCRVNTSTLKTAVDRQNDALEAVRAEGAAKVAESRKAVSAARSVAESYRREAQRVLAAKPGSVDRCEAASLLIDGVVG